MNVENKGKLTLFMRVAQEQEIAQFDLREGETLEQRVKEEIKKAVEAGVLKSTLSRPTAAVVSVGESNEDGTGIRASALFTAVGNEVTDRLATLSMQDGLYLLTGTDYKLNTETGEKEEVQTLLGAFPEEDIANFIGNMWKAGLI
jgi:hypothetical protein